MSALRRIIKKSKTQEIKISEDFAAPEVEIIVLAKNSKT